jgi:protein-tyrosine phosphatase
VKQNRLIPEIGKIEAEKNELDQSKTKLDLSKAWQDQENDEVYLKSIVETQHLKCRHIQVQHGTL